MLSQLPCWADLTPEQYREQVAGLVEEIEAEARAGREARGIEPMGVEAILRQDPHNRPNHTKKSSAPAVHAASKVARQAFWEAYSTFLAAFREAAEKLKAVSRLETTIEPNRCNSAPPPHLSLLKALALSLQQTFRLRSTQPNKLSVASTTI